MGSSRGTAENGTGRPKTKGAAPKDRPKRHAMLQTSIRAGESAHSASLAPAGTPPPQGTRIREVLLLQTGLAGV